MDFKEYTNTRISNENRDRVNEDEFRKNVEEETKKTMHKYANYSQDQLVQEFLRISKEQMNKGELNHEKLDQIFMTLSPYLSEEQKRLFQDLKGKL